MAHINKLGPYSLSLGGSLDAAVTPLTGLGLEVVFINENLTKLQGIRVTSGSSGTTTIELEVNGTASGDTLSWLSTDADNTLKTATISLALSIGDRLTFRVNSVEVGAEDIHLQVSN